MLPLLQAPGLFFRRQKENVPRAHVGEHRVGSGAGQHFVEWPCSGSLGLCEGELGCGLVKMRGASEKVTLEQVLREE